MPHAVDVHVGKRLRQRRWALSLSQHQLAERIGVKFQQIQKYESGQNRVSASRLYEIARELGVRINYFFDELPGGHADEGMVLGDTLADREAQALIQAYAAIPAEQRKRLFDLARSIGETASKEQNAGDRKARPASGNSL